MFEMCELYLRFPEQVYDFLDILSVLAGSCVAVVRLDQRKACNTITVILFFKPLHVHVEVGV
jgi:hypothetical protein